MYCSPGRWFATQELKLLVAYVTLKYDIGLMNKRPSVVAFGDVIWASHSTRIEVRKRKHI